MKQLLHTEEDGKKLYSIDSFEDLVVGATLWFHRRTYYWFQQEIIIKSWEPASDHNDGAYHNSWGYDHVIRPPPYWITDVRGRE